MARVFLSHTAELRALPEPRSFVAAVEAAVIRAGHVVVDMAYFTAHDRPPAQLDRDLVAGADVYVLLAGFRYGTPVRDRPGVSYTEHEFEIATELGLPRLVFLLSERAIGPSGLFRDPEHGARQEAFRQRLRDSGVTTTDVVSPDHAETLVFDALTKLPRAGSAWNIPARPARFTGREALLAELRATVTGARPAVIQAVHGMGGVGKTTLAIEYAHRNAADYDVAWWIPAERPDLIPGRLATLAQALGLATGEDGTEAAVARLSGALLGRDRWLLIFDNAEEPAALTPFLPGGRGHVIITSRNPHWDAIAAPVEIAQFTRAESVTHIHTRLPGLTDAADIAEAVGDLPLAVDQAAALLVDTGWTVSAYLRQLRDRAARLFDHRDQASGYPLSVAAAWQVTFDQLAAADPAALQLVTLAAWLAPEPIPLTLFTDQAAMLPEPLAGAAHDALAWAGVLEVLRHRAVGKVGAETLLLHRIPAALLRAHGPVAAPVDGWAALAVRLLRVATPRRPRNRPGTWPTWRSLLPHVLAATDPAREPDTAAASVDMDHLLSGVASYLFGRGDRRTALSHYRRAYVRCRTRLGRNHPTTLLFASNLAGALSAVGAPEQSRELIGDTLVRRRRVLGRNHPDTLVAANNLAVDLLLLGEHEQARGLIDDTARRRRRVLGEDHPDTLSSNRNLARCLSALGMHETARELDKETFHRFRAVLGHDHPSTLASANNLACDLLDTGALDAARDLHRDTLDRRRRVLGEYHPDTLNSVRNLARVLDLLGECDVEVAGRYVASWAVRPG